MSLTAESLTPEEELLVDLAGYGNDALGWVHWAFPWGEPGDLEKYTGPEEWQAELLTQLSEGAIAVDEAIAAAMAFNEDAEADPIQLSRCSGHGIGKSACVAWIILWAISTFEDTKGVVTANTENQLKTKTWAEVAKWHRLFIGKRLFKMTATALFSADPDHEKTWRIDMVPWSEKNMEAFAGLHNQGKRIIVVFDEASAIHDLIWETTEGALTDKNTQIFWVCFGNPTKSSGRFRECFPGGRFEKRWKSRAIDSREVSFTNKSQIATWIEDYGEDHDFVRVRVRGVFPRIDAASFISYELALEATKRPVPEHNSAPIILGVDCARFGDNKSVIFPRKGRDARTLRPRVFQNINTLQLTAEIVRAFHELGASAICIDTGSFGAAIYDNLLAADLPVYEVSFGSPDDQQCYGQAEARIRYFNKRSAIYGAIRTWLHHGCIPDEVPMLEDSLPTEMSGPTFTIAKEDVIQLESKKDMRRRGITSPDATDALACTLAFAWLDDLLPAELAAANNNYSSPNPYDEKDFANA